MASSIRAISFNLLADLRPHEGFERWPARRDAVGAALVALSADLVAVQECLFAQQDELAARLPGYGAVRCDLSSADAALRAEFRQRVGIELPEGGELMILYRDSGFELVERREAWLSETPERVSFGFGARAPRSLLAVRLRRRADGRTLWVANSRLDHRCPEPMARVGLELLEHWTAGAAALWLGDFNAGRDSAVGAAIAARGWLAPTLADDAFRGARTEHVWHRGLELVGARVIDSRAFRPVLSDHDPLLADLLL
jgi:endonuclease/exonuclease/phosphatase family metal-dependent hydrolase